MMDEGIIRNM